MAIICTSVLMSTNPCLGGVPTPVPSPTCQPGSIPATFGSDMVPTPTYVPGESITLKLMPVQGDWPTTPTMISWNSNFFDRYFSDDIETITFPDPGPNDIWIASTAIGDGIRPECNDWSSSTAFYRARRFDITPTPFATPSPTWAPPTPTSCTPVYSDCPSYIEYPKPNSTDVPTSFVLHFNDPLVFQGIEDLDNTQTINPIPLGENRYEISGLTYDTVYLVYLYCWNDPCTGVLAGFYTIETQLSPTPTPTGTITPTATAPPPSPTPTSAQPEAWLITSATARHRYPIPQPTPTPARTPFLIFQEANQ